MLAVDLDGRRYETLIGTGHPSGSAQVSEPGTPLLHDAGSPRLRIRRAALSALAHLAEMAVAMPGPQPADSDGVDEGDRDVLVAGELVTVTGDRFDDDQRKQLWAVVNAFFDYTIAVLGGDGYQWARIPRGELTRSRRSGSGGSSEATAPSATSARTAPNRSCSMTSSTSRSRAATS